MDQNGDFLFLDIVVDCVAAGRVIIKPSTLCNVSPAVINFKKYFASVIGAEECAYAHVSEIAPNRFVKCTWNSMPDDLLTNFSHDSDLSGPSEFTSAGTSLMSSLSISDDHKEDRFFGHVLVDSSAKHFYMVTSKNWCCSDNLISVGRIHKGLSLIGYISSLPVSARGKPRKSIIVRNAGFVSRKSNLSISPLEINLDPFPSFPEDAVDVDFRDAGQVVKIAHSIQRFGNCLMRERKFEMASFKFGKAIRYLSHAIENRESPFEDEDLLMGHAVSCLLSSKLKTKDFESALQLCNEAIEHAPSSSRAYFRRGQAYHGLLNYEQSLIDLSAAMRLAPNDVAIKREIAAVEGEKSVYSKSRESTTRQI